MRFRRVVRRPSALALLVVVPALAAAAAAGGPGRVVPVSEAPADSMYGALASTLERIGVPAAHQLGLTGQGVRVGVLDGPILTSHQAFADVHLVATRDFVDGDGDVDPGADPGPAGRGTAVWSLAGGRAPGVLMGPAFGASYALARTFEGTGAPREDETRWTDGLEWLESQGVRVVVTGGGFRTFDDGFSYPPEDLDGISTAPSMAAAQASDRGVLVVVPVGDLGPDAGSLIVPSDADGVGATGAVDPEGTVAVFSSMGPTADGREKPDLLSPGVAIPAAGAASDSEILEVDGTGAAAALLAGAATLFFEAYPIRSPRQVIEALQASARGRLSSNGNAGLFDIGSAVSFPDDFFALPLEEVDAQGQVTTLTPLFRWDAPTIFPQALPVSFTVVVAADTAFTDVLLAERVVGTFARRLNSPLPASQRLYWRVDAETFQAVTRTTRLAGTMTVPAWVTLSVLNDPAGSAIQERRPLLEWEPFEDLAPPAGPFRYDVTVFSDRDETPVATFEALDTTAVRPIEPLPLNEPLRWRVVARVPGGQADSATSAGPFVVTSSSSPPATILFQNFPNPFPLGGQRETKIWFDLERDSEVRLTVYDLRGRLVRNLIPAPGCSDVVLPPGLYGRDVAAPDVCIKLRWDGTNDGGQEVEPGVYLLRLRAGGTESVRRMVYWP